MQRYQLRAAARQAEAASRAKMDFLAAMSHEIRTPLNGIMGMIHFLNETSLNGKQKECLSTIENCSSALLNTLNDILDISKIEAGKFQINNVNFSLRHLVRSIYNLLLQKAEAKGITLHLEIDPRVPAYICADPHRMQQIIMNLISNALKFTDKGYVRISIKTRGQHNKSLYFEIKDTGIGMTRDQQKNLFQSFGQADSTIATKYGGTGLGLSISRQLVELMDGRIGVASEKGHGSLFWFEIPLIEALDGLEGHEEQEADLRIAQNLYVLIVEDNKVNQIILSRLLDKYNIAYDIAGDGEEAVKIMETAVDKYDMVFMDMQMPRMDGVTATRKIRAMGEAWQAIPIIGLTANVLDQHIQQCLDAGMIDYLSKPIDPKLLYKKIHDNQKIIENRERETRRKDNERKITSTIDEIRAIMGEEYAQNFIASAQEEINKLYNNIANAHSNGDMKVIRTNAHELKAISGSIGLLGIMQASEMLEMLSEAEADENLGAYIIQLGDAVKDTAQQITHH